MLIKGLVRVDIFLDADIMHVTYATTTREEFIDNPLHYLALLEQKPRTFDQMAPIHPYALPEVFDLLRRLLEAQVKRRDRKEYIQILRQSGKF